MKNNHSNTLIAVLAAAGSTLCAIAQPIRPVNEFVPFHQFVEQVRKSNAHAVREQSARVRSSEAFEEMRSHVLGLYDGVEVSHSFVKDASHFDCIPVAQQASARGLDGIAAPPPSTPTPAAVKRSSPAAVATPGTDEFGNSTTCEAGTVPMRRVTLEEMAQFPTLRHFLSKRPLSELAPATSNAAHKYAYNYQNVNNIGGSATLNIWRPYVDTSRAEVFSLSQEWYVGGTGSGTQTAEVGWQNFPSKYGTQNSVLFIYWTADNYAKTGCYNMDCGAFVQVDNSVTIGGSFGAYSTVGGDQQEVTAQFYLYNGDWWLSIDGTWVGYYKGSNYKGGQLTKYAQSIKFGTESVGTTVYPGEGSGYWSNTGWGNAAYQRSLFYFDTNGDAYWDTLTPANPSPKCYSTSGPLTSSSDGWELYFFVGGPGGTGC